ncbi:MAG: hypothetical protein PVH42_19110 [Desulfobacterales bacterium]
MVESVAPEFEDVLSWEKIITKDMAGARRYQEFSKFLGKPAPVPCIAINGRLVFDTTPGIEDLKACIARYIEQKSTGS